MSHIHVKDKSTGHEYVVPEHLFNPEAHEKTDKSPYDAHGDLAPVKFNVRLGASRKQSTDKADDKSGQKAETEKE